VAINEARVFVGIELPRNGTATNRLDERLGALEMAYYKRADELTKPRKR